jgi:hypothetical protein
LPQGAEVAKGSDDCHGVKLAPASLGVGHRIPDQAMVLNVKVFPHHRSEDGRADAGIVGENDGA